jgi:hypothetical protein
MFFIVKNHWQPYFKDNNNNNNHTHTHSLLLKTSSQKLMMLPSDWLGWPSGNPLAFYEYLGGGWFESLQE